MFEGLTSKQRIITISIISILSIIIIYYIYNKNSSYEITEEEILVKENSTENIIEENNSNNEIIIHIAGEVNKPGIVKIKEGKRIEDAIEKAGGLTEEADISNVNLAYILEDGIKIIIPNKNDSTKEYIIEGIDENIIDKNTNTDEANKNKTNIVNINKATQTQLETLQGIGPSLAGRIIAYREENGNFKTIEEIKNVSGIGDTKFENIKDSICVK